MDDIKQKISQFIDNELDAQQSLLLLKQIKQQPEFQPLLQRYQVAREILTTNQSIIAKPDFLAGIQDKLEDEVYYLPPTQQKPKNETQTLIALVASIAVIAFFVTKITLNEPNQRLNSFPIAAAKQHSIHSPKNTAIIIAKKHAQKPQFDNYIQAHNLNGYAHFKPYVKKAAYTSE